MSFAAQKRAGMWSRSAWSAMRWTTAWRQRCTGESAPQKSVTWGSVPARTVCTAWSMSSLTPSSLAAEMGTTGMPRALLIFRTSMEPPLALTSSIMFRARTMGVRSSRSCNVR